MHAFILAGGFATRLWPLTESRAKPLLPIAGKPLLQFLVDSIPYCKSLAIGSHLQLEGPNVSAITLSTNAIFQKDFEIWKKTHSVPVTILIEDAESDHKKLGALGAVSAWIQQANIQEDVLLLAGDNYTEANLAKFIALFRGNPLIAGHDIGLLESAKQFGTILLKDGDHPSLKQVLSFEEKPEHPKSTIVSTGWWILPSSLFPLLHEYAKKKPDNIGGIFEECLSHTIPIDCFTFADRWRDIGSFDAYLSLHKECVGSQTVIHPSSSLDKDTVCEGSVVLGPNVHVTASYLKDCMLFGESTIQDSHLEECILDTQCHLQGVDLHYSMLRAKTVLRK